MRPPTAKTISEAAEILVKGAHDGTILDRAGKPYKPSTARGYEQLLHAYVIPALGGWKLSELQRRDVQDFVDGLRTQGLSPSTIANILDPLRVIFRRAIRRDEVALDPTENLDLPAIRGRRDRIEPPEVAHELLAALPDTEKAFWAVALFCGLRRGELRGLQWTNVDFDNGVIRVERSWDPVKGPVDVKTGAGRRAVPMAFVVRRELMAHKQKTNRDGPDLVFGRTKTEAFFASTIRARANKAWTQAGLEPITPHEARHCAISYFIAAGLDWKQISTWAGHGDVRQTWNRYGHLVPGGEEQARERLDAYVNPRKPIPTVAHTVAQVQENDETPVNAGVLKYRYRDSKVGFRRERRPDSPLSSPNVMYLLGPPDTSTPSMCVAIAVAKSARNGAQLWDVLAEWYDLLMSHSEQVTVGDRGRVVLPASIRNELGLKAGTRMLATTEEDGSVRLQPYRAIAAGARGMFADLAPGVSLADELIAERRAEAARDE